MGSSLPDLSNQVGASGGDFLLCGARHIVGKG